MEAATALKTATHNEGTRYLTTHT